VIRPADLALPSVAVVITTRNRKANLRRALSSCVSQDYPTLEIRVYDDCSDDGTAAMIERDFPGVTVSVSPERRGYIALRTKAYFETDASYVLSLDDDAWLTDRSMVSVLVNQMERQASLGALAIPFVETAPPGESLSSRPQRAGSELRSYVGTAHFCRVSAVRQVGGYRELLVHQGEERDLCIRLRAAGWSIRLAEAPPIVHAVSPARDRGRMQRYGVRNQLLYDFFYAPWFVLPIVVAHHVARLVAYRRNVGWAARTLVYSMRALGDCWRYRAYRAPLPFSAYRSHLRLPAHGPQYVDRAQWPPPCG
jgi:glycosyltransferase involved in cell wall biosynthesis